MFNSSGTVHKTIINGKIINAHTAHISHTFSHSHLIVRFIGTAKLPFKTPEITAAVMPINVNIISP
jgi:hypothetical protein